MGLLAKLFRRAPPPAPVAPPPCPHVTLVPKWQSAADMGHEDKVSGYTCDSCKQSFSTADGRTLLRTEAERVKHPL